MAENFDLHGPPAERRHQGAHEAGSSPEQPALKQEQKSLAPMAQAPGAPAAPRSRGLASVLVVLAVALAVGFGWFWVKHQRASQTAAATPTGGPRAGFSNAPVPIVAGTVATKDVPIYLDGLGTVQAFNTVTVRSRVDGEVQKIAFQEGQDVRAGQLLAQIDAGPYQTQLDQNVAKKAQDEAQLEVARLTLARDEQLLTSKILAQQDYDTQRALVDQLQAAVKADEAAIGNAKVQLAYTSITAPLDGRVGLRIVDQGNIIHANDVNGIVVITQLRPISVVFTLPEQDLRSLQEHRGGDPLRTLAVDRDNRTTLDEGQVAVIDNQIDTNTATIRLKATFPNEDLRLWPGQFVNVRVLIQIVKAGTVVPATVVQRGPEGTFAYIISNATAQVRPIKVTQIEQGQALIAEGLTPGEQVVVDGQYKLKPGSLVKLTGSEGPNPNPPDGGQRELGRQKNDGGVKKAEDGGRRTEVQGLPMKIEGRG